MAEQQGAMELVVHPIRVAGDTLCFEWRESVAANLFRAPRFFVRYPGVDLERSSPEARWAVFLGLVMPLYAYAFKTLSVVLPESVDRELVSLWLSYHDLGNVRIGPLHDGVIAAPAVAEPQRVGILFGGGKDSLFAAGVLQELFGPENVTLLSCVFPTQKRNVKQVEARRDAFALQPVTRVLGVGAQKLITDLRGVLRRGTDTHRLHSSLYHALYAPLVPALGLDLITHSNEFNHYWTAPGKQGLMPRFNYRRSRPEYDDFVAARLGGVLGRPFQIKNLNFCLSKEGSVRVLQQRYPALLDEIMMCEATPDPRQRWCGKCYKCFQYALYALYFDLRPRELDLRWFFADSPFVDKALRAIAEAREGGVASGWLASLSSRASFPSFCHLLATVDLAAVRARLDARGFAHFLAVRDQFPLMPNPLLEGYMVRALDRLGPPRRAALERLLAAHLQPVEDTVIKLYWGSRKVRIDYAAEAPIPARTA